jgi:hypothetical protein
MHLTATAITQAHIAPPGLPLTAGGAPGTDPTLED